MNEKIKNTIAIIFIILALGVIGYCGYRIYNKLNGNDTETKENKTEEKKNETPVVNEEELTDNLVKQDVLDKLNVILGLNCDDEPIFSINNNFIQRKHFEFCNRRMFDDLFKIGLFDNDKLIIALNNTDDKKIEYNETTLSKVGASVKDKMKRVLADPENEHIDLYVINIENVKNTYNELFGKNIKEFDVLNNDGHNLCRKPDHSEYMFYFDKENKIYYRETIMAGMGSGSAGFLLYINNITINNNDDVYVYINNAWYENRYTNSNDCGIIDFESEKEIFVGKYNIDNGIKECEHFKIDESNYKEFTNYRFIFKKNNEGNYYFDSVEKVK